MSNIQITIMTILAVAGGITTLVACAKMIFTFFDPFKRLKSRVDKHDMLLGNDNVRLNELAEGNRIQCRALLQLINHMLDGNHVDKMKEVRKAIEEYLIDK